MGFNAIRIGGAGNTDVIVRWKDEEGEIITAIVDGKSKSTGTVTHGDISDVAIETHKEKNNANYVAIVGPGFSGDTIKNYARKKGFALITDKELADIAVNAKVLGLSLVDVALIFKVPNGLSQLEELINTFELLSTEEIGVLTQIKKDSATENNTYSMCNEAQTVNRLRALATAIEKGIN